MNSYWSTYGCNIPGCTTYPVLVLTVNFSDSKANFQSGFITPLGVCVPKEDGGSTFNTILSNANYGGPTYLIKPDKSFTKNPSLISTLTSLGVQPHVHGGGITQFGLTVNATNGTVAKSPSATTYDSATVVQLTATPSTGYTFSGWSGDASGTANPVSVTMNAAKSVTATFTLIPVTIDTTNPSGNLVDLTDWDAGADGASTAALDITGIAGGNGVKGTFTIGSADTNWAYLSNSFDIDLGGATYVKLVYKASKANVMSLSDPVLSETGEGYGVNLPVANGSWSTKVYKIDNTVFKQPSGATAAAFDLTKVLGFSFSPGSLDYNVSPAGTSTIEVKELVVYGKGALMIPDAIHGRPAAMKSAGFVKTGSMLQISGMSGVLTMYSLSGRLVVRSVVNGSASIDLSGLTAGTYLTKLTGNGITVSDRIVIGK